MKKEKKESVFFQRYMSILDEIDDDMFVHENIRVNMRIKYKNAKKENSGQSLWRKYETELTEIRNFAKKIPGAYPIGTTSYGLGYSSGKTAEKQAIVRDWYTYLLEQCPTKYPEKGFAQITGPLATKAKEQIAKIK